VLSLTEHSPLSLQGSSRHSPAFQTISATVLRTVYSAASVVPRMLFHWGYSQVTCLSSTVAVGGKTLRESRLPWPISQSQISSDSDLSSCGIRFINACYVMCLLNSGITGREMGNLKLRASHGRTNSRPRWPFTACGSLLEVLK